MVSVLATVTHFIGRKSLAGSVCNLTVYTLENYIVKLENCAGASKLTAFILFWCTCLLCRMM